MNKFLKSFILIGSLCFLTIMSACSKDEEPMRTPQDIVGIWSPGDNVYLEFTDKYTVYNLLVTEQYDETVGIWTRDSYIYEPGYNIVVYLSATNVLEVYEVVSLTPNTLTWCWVKTIDNLESYNSSNIGELLGSIINEAQEGFHLDPELYQSFNRLSRDKFFSILESLDIDYIW